MVSFEPRPFRARFRTPKFISLLLGGVRPKSEGMLPIKSSKRVKYTYWILSSETFAFPTGTHYPKAAEVVAYLINVMDTVKFMQRDDMGWAAKGTFHAKVPGHVTHGHWLERPGYVIAFKKDGSRAFAIYKEKDFFQHYIGSKPV